MKEKISNKENIIKDTFQLTSARYLSQVIGFFTAIGLRRFLGPFYVGIWSLLKVVMEYSSHLFLGVDKGVAYSIPLFVGGNKLKQEEEIKDAAFSFIAVATLLISICLIIAGFLLKNTYPNATVIGIWALAAYMILDKACTYYRTLLRAKRRFSVLSKTIIFDALINLILIFTLVRFFSIYGLYATVIIVTAVNIIYMHLLAKYTVRFNFNVKVMRNLIKVGFPISIVGTLELVLLNLDRIMIAKMIGITFVGYYSIPLMAKSYVNQLSSFGTVLYPRMLESYGRNENIEDIKKYVTVPLSINAYMLPLFLGLMFFIVPVLIEKILPKFIPGILAMQILLIDMFFRSCYPQAFHFIIAMKKQARVIPIVVAAILLNILGNFILIRKGYGIYGVACATSIVSFLSFVVIQSYAMKHFAGIREIILFLIKIMAPFVYTVAVVAGLNRFIVIDNLYAQMLTRSVLLIIFSIPMLYHINRETGVIKLISKTIRSNILRKGQGTRDE